MCGVFGAYGIPDLFNSAFQAMHMLQHRGADAAGMIFSDGEKFLRPHRKTGSIERLRNTWPEEYIPQENPRIVIAHNRYKTSGEEHTNPEDIQPLVRSSRFGPFALTHNGDTPNYLERKKELEREGVSFSSTSDTELLMHAILRENTLELPQAIVQGLGDMASAYACVAATPDTLFGFRDPSGNRPLVLGRLGDGYVLASETSVFHPLGARYIRQVNPGELVWIDRKGLHAGNTILTKKHVPLKQCAFEPVYFAYPSSKMFERPVTAMRRALGAQLADEYHLPYPDTDVVIIPIPDSGIYGAEGYSHATRKPLTFGLIRHHYTGRSFIAPNQGERSQKVRLKFSADEWLVRGKYCITVDDSMVRGTTTTINNKMLRESGASRIVNLFTYPLIFHPCITGINMKTYEELIAARLAGDREAIRQELGADDVYCLSYEGFKKVLGDHENYCLACLDGNYIF